MSALIFFNLKFEESTLIVLTVSDELRSQKNAAHLLNQITFEHEIQGTKYYGVSKMMTNSTYYNVSHFGCFLLCNLEFSYFAIIVLISMLNFLPF